MTHKRKGRQFSDNMKKKLLISMGIILAVFVVLIGKLIYITVTAGKEYEQKVLAQQGYTSTIIPAKRGDIYDANGTVLATSKKVYNVILEPKNILEKEEITKATCAALKLYFGITDSEMDEFLENKESYYVVARKKQPYETVKAFNE